MLTLEQEQYLAALADKGLAEQSAEAARIVQAEADRAVAAAREAKLADLKVQAQTLIETGMADFETNVATDIKPPK